MSATSLTKKLCEVGDTVARYIDVPGPIVRRPEKDAEIDHSALLSCLQSATADECQ